MSSICRTVTCRTVSPTVRGHSDFCGLGAQQGWSFCWIVFELLGAAMAAALFRIIRSEEFGRSDCDGVVAIGVMRSRRGSAPRTFYRCPSMQEPAPPYSSRLAGVRQKFTASCILTLGWPADSLLVMAAARRVITPRAVCWLCLVSPSHAFPRLSRLSPVRQGGFNITTTIPRLLTLPSYVSRRCKSSPRLPRRCGIELPLLSPRRPCSTIRGWAG